MENVTNKERGNMKTLETKCRKRMTEDVRKLINGEKESCQRWCTCNTDLIEGIYIAYLSESIMTTEGNPMSFKEMVTMAYNVLGTKQPANPRAYVYRAQTRKGTRQYSLIRRCMNMHYY